MGFFNFIETFFFISLGITFILLLSLVYHFKTRLSGLEKKNETMFEIVNSMVKEMTTIKKLAIQTATNAAANTPSANIVISSIPPFQSLSQSPPMNMADDISSCSEMDGWSDEEDEEIIISDTEDDIGDDTVEDMEDMEVMEDTEEIEKIPQMEHDILPEEAETFSNLEETQNHIIFVPELQEEKPLNDEMVSSEIIVSKIPVEETEPEQQHTFDETDNEQKINNREVYRKMNISQLRALVISKGLISDTTGLKKGELLNLLDSQE